MLKKNWFTALLIVFVLGTLPVLKAQGEIFDDISYSIESGNANELAGFFASRIELTILEEEDVYSRRQAEMVMSDFFEENSPQDFEVIHQGASNEKARYAIGFLETSNGSYRTYVYVTEEDDDKQIKELRFEKE